MQHCPTCGELIPQGTTGCEACGSSMTGSVILADSDSERERTETDSEANGAVRLAIHRTPIVAELSYGKALALLVPTALLSGFLAAWLVGRAHAPAKGETESRSDVLEPAPAQWFCWTSIKSHDDKEILSSHCARSLERCRDSQAHMSRVDDRPVRTTVSCYQTSAVFCPTQGDLDKATCFVSLDACLGANPSCRLAR